MQVCSKEAYRIGFTAISRESTEFRSCRASERESDLQCWRIWDSVDDEKLMGLRLGRIRLL